MTLEDAYRMLSIHFQLRISFAKSQLYKFGMSKMQVSSLTLHLKDLVNVNVGVTESG